MVDKATQLQIAGLRKEYEFLREGRESLLRIIGESELPEQVYNSNAIENSTLTLKETERILLEQTVMRSVSVRELFEAKNLARVIAYLDEKPGLPLAVENITLLHQMLLGGINDDFAGRLRREGEYVRVGRHIAPPPEHVPGLLAELLATYHSDHDRYFLDTIAYFHVGFESIHPFCDGNGRIGRVLVNQQLAALGYPPVIIRNKGKQKDYYPLFQVFEDDGVFEGMTALLSRALRESLHKRLAYLRGERITRLTDHARAQGLSVTVQLNAAKRQTIPAFRERGIWMIGEKQTPQENPQE
ncbi:MAG: Fic family protein [Eggerthellaceae bacterium]|jgi:Fic family protein|nr:Fic family protein [Eggerthellaceae bacterium]MDR2715852.1 Fic family protein [Coriobacteriaceae bacterium]